MGFLSESIKNLSESATFGSGGKSRGGINDSSSSISMSEVLHHGSNATRFQKAIVGTNSIVSEVTKFDPDGVDIVMVGGKSIRAIKEEEEETQAEEEEEACVEWHRNVTDTEGLEALVTKKEPRGDCMLGKAMEEVLNDVLSNDLSKRPCSVLVLTAGMPDDPEVLENSLKSTAQAVADRGGLENMPLSVTFIQIGNEPDAAEYIQYLDKEMKAHSIRDSEESNKQVDIVDAMTFDEIKETMDAMHVEAEKSITSSGKKGALIGALTGAAIGAGGMYLASKNKAKKRMKSGSYGGKWKCYYDDEEIATLDVTDDKNGNITIDGLVNTMHGTYAPDDEDEFWIQFTDPNGDVVTGEFNEELFILNWSDGTRWEALNKTSVGAYIGAAAAGAAILGGTGYMIDKKFFSKMNSKDQCDYIVVIDRSEYMDQKDK